MTDKLILHEIALECRLGVYDWERVKPQTIWIDLELEIDAARAAVVDDVRAAVDYGALVTAVKQLAQQRPYNLLETLGELVAAMILRDFSTPRVRVRIKKRALPGIDYAAVELERIRRRDVRRTAAAPARRQSSLRRAR